MPGPAYSKLEEEKNLLRIRMKRVGKKHRAYFRICAIDQRAPRDGREIEILGTYDPVKEKDEEKVVIKRERMVEWLDKGAQPSEKVAALLRKQGIHTN